MGGNRRRGGGCGDPREVDSGRIRQEFLEAELTEESESDDELPVVARSAIPDSELPPQYWFLLKMVKYIKVITLHTSK